jgi:hypothetical protein
MVAVDTAAAVGTEVALAIWSANSLAHFLEAESRVMETSSLEAMVAPAVMVPEDSVA